MDLADTNGVLEDTLTELKALYVARPLLQRAPAVDSLRSEAKPLARFAHGISRV